MDIILIAAITVDGFIARHSHEVVTWTKDLKLFKEQTWGYPVIMGSNTYATLAVELDGREMIVIHRNDNPEDILASLQCQRCFVIGGGKTFTRFAAYLTHLYLTIHPLVFGQGIPLFPGLDRELSLTFEKVVPINREKGIFQIQYRVMKEGIE